MLKNRLIPVVLLKNGVVVQSKYFRRYQRLGNPITIVQRLSDWASDELIYIDISQDNEYNLNREDLNFSNPDNILDILKNISKFCIIPLAFGGGIRNLEDVEKRLVLGADKITINSEALSNPYFIEQCAKEFGSQAIVVSIDAKEFGNQQWEVYTNGNRVATGKNAANWAKEAQERGAGEILINSIDRDGSGIGYDLGLVKSVCTSVSIPVIALGGAKDWTHFAAGLEAGADAVAAANIFSYIENSVYKTKQILYEKGYNVRPPEFFISSDL